MVSKRYSRTQTGFSLIEILISLVIISIGMLGLGGLQLSSLKGANNAHFRTVASLAATDLVDRMRANRLAVEKGFYLGSLGAAHCGTALAKVCEGANECTAEDLAKYDLYRVNCGVSVGLNQTGGVQYDLPQAALVVSGCAAPPCEAGDEHTIQVSWNEIDGDDDNDDVQARSHSLSFVPH